MLDKTTKTLKYIWFSIKVSWKSSSLDYYLVPLTSRYSYLMVGCIIDIRLSLLYTVEPRLSGPLLSESLDEPNQNHVSLHIMRGLT